MSTFYQQFLEKKSSSPRQRFTARKTENSAKGNCKGKKLHKVENPVENVKKFYIFRIQKIYFRKT